MIYMIIFWVILLAALIIYFFMRNRLRRASEIVSIVLIILAWSFLIVAIVQKDPLFSGFGVPAEFEWIVGLFITALSSWKLYFDPLKQRVINTEKEVSAIKAEVSSIKSDTTLIKEKIIEKK